MGPSTKRTSQIVILSAIIAALYLGRAVVLPFALAALIALGLDPLVEWMRRRGLPRLVAVILVVFLTLGAFLGCIGVVAYQVSQLLENLPRYEANIAKKARFFGQGSGFIEDLEHVAQRVNRELSAGSAGNEPQPTRVVVVDATTKPLARVKAMVGPLIGPLGTAGLVTILLLFMLLQKADLRDRFIKVAASGNLHATTEAMGVAAQRVGRYLFMHVVVNLTHGVAVGLGLFWLGVPNAPLWALLSFVLRFIPFLGPVIAAAFPIALAVAVDPGWSMAIGVVILIIILEAISNNIIEPLLYGSGTGVSSLAIIVAAVFFTLLWGTPGLVLSTPLTVCLVVLGQHVPSLRAFADLFGNETPLTPPEQLYQRLLANNQAEAYELAEREVAKSSVTVFLADVAVPMLRMVEADRSKGALSLETRRNVVENMTSLARDLSEHAPEPATENAPVVCLGASTELDGVAAEILKLALVDVNCSAQVLPTVALSNDYTSRLSIEPLVACLVYLGDQPFAHARIAVRRLRRRYPRLVVVVAALGVGENRDMSVLAVEIGADVVTTRLNETVGRVRAQLPADTKKMVRAETPEDEADRLAMLKSLGISFERSASYDNYAMRAAEALDVPMALVSIVGESRQIWLGACGLPGNLAKERGTTRGESVCAHVVAAGDALVVEDFLKDPRFAESSFLLNNGMRSYAGVPLRVNGYVLGTIAIIDTKPRTFSAADEEKLTTIAADVAKDILPVTS